MTTEAAKKRAMMRRKNVHFGEVRRDEAGNVIMIELHEYRPNPLAPSILVNKIGGIYRVSDTLMKVTFILATPTSTGAIETVERISLLWETVDMVSANEECNWAMTEYVRGTFLAAVLDDGGGRKPRTQ